MEPLSAPAVESAPVLVPRPHQEEALTAITAELADGGRALVVMACGTGKSLVGAVAAQRLGAERTLVLAPTLVLLDQLIRTWRAAGTLRGPVVAVCSDGSVGQDDERATDLPVEVTADAKRLGEFMTAPGPVHVFATYQSSPVVRQAMTASEIRPFDLVVADEAHHCVTDASSPFATVLDATAVRATRRVFMTATPRRRVEGSKGSVVMVGMDDERTFGRTVYNLGFREAIEADLLADYRLVAMGLKPDAHEVLSKDGVAAGAVDVRDVATQIGLLKAIEKYGLRRVLTFHSRVKSAEHFASTLGSRAAQVKSLHVSGKTSVEVRQRSLAQLASETQGCVVISNARVLGEGVDVPAIDAVLFADPRSSAVDIAQAVGRALRKAPGKDAGTIMVPVWLGEDGESQQYEALVHAIRALADHDSAFNELIQRACRPRTARSAPEKEGEVWQDLIGAGCNIVADPEVARLLARGMLLEVLREAGLGREWAIRYSDLEAHAASHGHCFVGRGSTLGRWAAHQRMERRRGRLSAERIQALERLSGWVWDPAASAAWPAAFAEMAAFATVHGHCRVPKGQPLQGWINRRRMERRQGRLSAERIQALERLAGWDWDPAANAWPAAFAELAAFAAAHGHCRVPKGHPAKLWIKRQRLDRRRGRLSAERTRALERLVGWDWNPRRRAEPARGRALAA